MTGRKINPATSTKLPEPGSAAASPTPWRATIGTECFIEGRGVHGGEWCRLGLHPAPAGHGIVFQRTDLPGTPLIPARLENLVSDALLRRTTLESDGQRVFTIEHVMSAAFAMGITDLLVTMDHSEPPFLDGSALPFTRMISEAGITRFTIEAPTLRIDKPLSFRFEGSEINVLPSNAFQVSCFYTSDHPNLRSEAFHGTITPDFYREQVAPARTFCFFEEIEALRKANLIRGANLASAVVIGRKAILNNSLRFPNEPVRHKMLDFIGDLALAGVRFQAHFLAWRPGHRVNAEFAGYLKKELLT